ncbi:MAG: ROK family transcriptional regulator [Chloroflexota bacterium]
MVDQLQASSSSDLRRANIGRLLRSVHTQGPASRAELARTLGLARSTIGSLVEELVARGLVAEGPARESTGRGRPSPVVGASPAGPVVVALDISTDSLAAAVVGIGGEVFRERRVERERRPQDAEDVVALLRDLATPMVAEVGAGRVIAIGVSSPGSIQDGYLRASVNLGWRAVALDRMVADSLGLDVPVAVGNDANAATVAEHIRGAGVGVSDLVVLWGEEGIGAGIVAGGRPLMGHEGYAGRVGHWPLSTEGITCGCGSVRCWETVIGEEALLRRLGAQGATRRAAVERAIGLLVAEDPVAEAAFRPIAGWLGIGIAALAETFNPQVIVLGGFLGRLFRYAEAEILAQLREPDLSPPRESVRVVPSRLGGESALLGAAELAFAGLLADPTAYRRRRTGRASTYLARRPATPRETVSARSSEVG